jgi:predicted esterase
MMVIFIGALHAQPPPEPGFHTYYIEKDYRKRFLVWVPEGYPNDGPYHLFIAIHGTTMNGEHYMDLWHQVNHPQLIVASPTTMPMWYPGFKLEPATEPGEGSYDATEFIFDIIDTMKVMYDYQFTFMNGFSVGGHFCYYFHLRWPEIFDGSWPVAGALLDERESPLATRDYLDNATGENFVIWHDEDDSTVPFEFATRAESDLINNGADVRTRFTSGKGHSVTGNIQDFVDAIDWMITMANEDAGSIVSGSDIKALSAAKISWQEMKNRNKMK